MFKMTLKESILILQIKKLRLREVWQTIQYNILIQNEASFIKTI